MAVVVEVLSSANEPILHEVFNSNCIRVGRAHSADLYLNDEYVDEQHLLVKVNDDQSIVVNDQHSVNGMLVNGKSYQESNTCIADTITIGRTRLRIFHSNEAVPAAKKLHALEQYVTFLSKKRLLTIMCVLITALLVGQQYFASFTKFDPGSAIPDILARFLVFAALPLLFALLALLNKKETRLISQFNVVLIGYLLIELFGYLMGFLNFNYDFSIVKGLLPSLFAWGLGIAMLWLLLYLAFYQSNKKRTSIALTIIGLIASVTYLPGMFDDKDFIAAPHFNSSMTSPSFLIASPQSTTDFVEHSENLFVAVDAELKASKAKDD